MIKNNPAKLALLYCLVLPINNATADVTVTSLNALNTALGEQTTEKIVFDAAGIDNVDGFVSVGENQSVEMKNIAAWTNAEPTEPGTPGKERLILNNGLLALNNINFINNKLFLNEGAQNGGGIVKNVGGTITEISNITMCDNNVATPPSQDIWGGLIENTTVGTINVIKDSVFANNTIIPEQSAPHGAIIFNGSTNGDPAGVDTINLIDNVVFQNNVMQARENQKGGAHGTTIDNNEYGIINKITNSRFIDNRTYKPGADVYAGDSNHASGGAMDNYHIIGEISNSLFQGNNAEIESVNKSGKMYARGGAIVNTYAGSSANGRIDKIINTQFIENYTRNVNGEAMGGALASVGSASQIQEMTNLLFRGNYAQGDGTPDGKGKGLGGAIYNVGTVGKLNAEFVGNKALSKNAVAQGGAIWNSGTITNLENSLFVDNAAVGGTEQTGGAIWNSGTINFSGQTVFSGNKTGVSFNDIHNNGTITFADSVVLDGGISGEGNVVFNEGAELSATLNRTNIVSDTLSFAGNNNISLRLTDVVSSAEYDFITASITGLDSVTISENLVYDMTLNDDGKVSVAMKNKNEIEQGLGKNMNMQSAQIVSNILQRGAIGNGDIRHAANGFYGLVQNNDFDQVQQELRSFGPNPSFATEHARSLNTMLLSMTEQRIVSLGRSGGDKKAQTSVWMQGAYGYAQNDGQHGFNADTTGFVLGADMHVLDDFIFGMGYGYTNTSADMKDNRTLDVDGHTVFAYGHYQPTTHWYADVLMSYGFNNYNEEKNPVGLSIQSEYDVDTWAINMSTGYDMPFGFTPTIGMRYLFVEQDKYNDVFQTIETENNDVLTAVAGAKYSFDFQVGDFDILPRAKVMATYDIVDSKQVANVDLIGGASYQVTGEDVGRIGVETGIGIEANYGNISFSIDYVGALKKDYQNHMGVVGFKYAF